MFYYPSEISPRYPAMYLRPSENPKEAIPKSEIKNVGIDLLYGNEKNPEKIYGKHIR